MILNTGQGEVKTGGVQASTSFGFNMQDLKFIKKILRDSIYSDKILAVIREYSANAWDAHRMSGKGDKPIKVLVPTWDDPRLLIEDYGPGLSHDDVFEKFTKYGLSTKRETNDGVGMLGIGCKCGFCYSSTFIISSRYGGEKRVYVAKLNMDGDDSLDLLSTTPWTEDTGVTIEIAVRKEDINTFSEKARNLFRYFEPRPDINISLPPVPQIKNKLQHGLIFEQGQYGNTDTTSGKWLALMGCIPYPVDLDQLRDVDGKPTISHIFKRCAGILDFDVGAIQISSSRESLEYSKETKEALTRKFEDLLDEYLQVLLNEIESGDGTPWEKRLKSQRLLTLGMTEKEIGDWAKENLKIEGDTFRLNRYIHVHQDTRLIREIIPEGKDLRGYHLYGDQHVLINPKLVTQPGPDGIPVPVEPPQFFTWAEVNAELEQKLAEANLTGIPVIDIDTLDWQPPYKKEYRGRAPRVSGPKDSKHVKRLFKLTGTESYRGKKYSDNWEIVDHAPKPDDVYVIIKEFLPEEAGVGFFDQRNKDLELANVFGVQLPEVYGYKSTDSKPVDKSKIVGVPYHEWRTKWRRSLAESEDVRLAMEFFAWRDCPAPRKSVVVKNSDGTGRREIKPRYSELVMNKLTKEFGEDHEVLVYLKSALWAREVYAYDIESWRKKISALDSHGVTLKEKPFEPDLIMRKIYEKYPLMRGNKINVLWGSMSALHWRQYIRCIDREVKHAVQP